MTFNTKNFGAMMQKMSGGREIETSHNDPIYQMLVRRKNNGEDTQLPPEQSFPQQDIDALESFCKQHGILGFNFGRMHPKAALSMLKNKMGMPAHTEITSTQSKSLLKG